MYRQIFEIITHYKILKYLFTQKKLMFQRRWFDFHKDYHHINVYMVVNVLSKK